MVNSKVGIMDQMFSKAHGMVQEAEDVKIYSHID